MGIVRLVTFRIKLPNWDQYEDIKLRNQCDHCINEFEKVLLEDGYYVHIFWNQ